MAVPYGGVDTVLVMPRGNLEGICPRLLVLAAIAEALDAAAFSTAWELAVTHRCVFEGGFPKLGNGRDIVIARTFLCLIQHLGGATTCVGTSPLP